MTEETSTDMRPAAVAKSDQWNADDLLGGPATVTIARAIRFDRKDQPVEIALTESPTKCYRPCKTMVRALIAALGPDGSKWAGRRITLYRDPSTMWAGEEVGGIRVSHLSGLRDPLVLMLQIRRGQKAKVTILPLPSAETAPALPDVMARQGIEIHALEAWAAAKGKPPIAGLDDAARAKLAGWLARAPAETIAEIQTSTAREPGQEG